jgi:hypothetical protein
MRLYASVLNGQLRLGPIGQPYEISVAPDNAGLAKLTSYIEKKTLGGEWDGHIICSSSMDFPEEDGWPAGNGAHYFVQVATRRAFKNIKKRAASHTRSGVLAVPESFDRGGR